MASMWDCSIFAGTVSRKCEWKQKRCNRNHYCVAMWRNSISRFSRWTDWAGLNRIPVMCRLTAMCSGRNIGRRSGFYCEEDY